MVVYRVKLMCGGGRAKLRGEKQAHPINERRFILNECSGRERQFLQSRAMDKGSIEEGGHANKDQRILPKADGRVKRIRGKDSQRASEKTHSIQKGTQEMIGGGGEGEDGIIGEHVGRGRVR